MKEMKLIVDDKTYQALEMILSEISVADENVWIPNTVPASFVADLIDMVGTKKQAERKGRLRVEDVAKAEDVAKDESKKEPKKEPVKEELPTRKVADDNGSYTHVDYEALDVSKNPFKAWYFFTGDEIEKWVLKNTDEAMEIAHPRAWQACIIKARERVAKLDSMLTKIEEEDTGRKHYYECDDYIRRGTVYEPLNKDKPLSKMITLNIKERPVNAHNAHDWNMTMRQVEETKTTIIGYGLRTPQYYITDGNMWAIVEGREPQEVDYDAIPWETKIEMDKQAQKEFKAARKDKDIEWL